MPSPAKLAREAKLSKCREAEASLYGKHSTLNLSQSDSSSDADSSHSDHPEYGILLDDLDDPMQCEFQHGEQVWVKVKEPCEEWVRGEVSGIGRRTKSTRIGAGMLYSVRYKETKRAMFSPQNGMLKPDTQQVRDLLATGGWLQ